MPSRHFPRSPPEPTADLSALGDLPAPGAGRQPHHGPAGVGQKPGVITQAVDHLADARDGVEVLAEAKDVEHGTEHSSTMRA
jgi:hypothetical protein